LRPAVSSAKRRRVGAAFFAERFEDKVVAERSRRTSRLECLVHHLGLTLGGRPAADFTKRLIVPVSSDTLLRVVRRRSKLPEAPLNVVGIDDWAWRQDHRYGSIVCDLERHRIVTLLPDREIATVRAWPAEHPQITVVSRDRGRAYGEAVTKALPNAVQVADRWRLMENASSALRKSMRSIRTAIGAAKINPDLLTCAEKLQYEGYLRREEMNAVIARLAGDGVPIKEIVRRTGHSRKLVRQVIRGERTDIFRIRQSSLESHLPVLDEMWNGGCRNGAELWRRLKAKGYRGSLRVRRVGDPPPLRRARIRQAPSKGAFGQDHRAFDDHGPRSPQQIRHGDHSRHRKGRAYAGRGPKSDRQVPSDDPDEVREQPRRLDHQRQREPGSRLSPAG
jgi:hypothetical protein